MARYTHKYKFITSQPDKYGEYYVYRFSKKDKETENCIVYKMKGVRLHPIFKFQIQKNDYNGFKNIQETIEERKFI